MNGDDILLICSLSVYWISLLLLVSGAGHKTRMFWGHTLAHLLYGTYPAYALFFRAQGGSGMVWWFYLLLSITVHTVILWIQAVYFRYMK